MTIKETSITAPNPGIGDALIEAVKALPSHQLLWLSGFSAGLAEGQQLSNSSVASHTQSDTTLSIKHDPLPALVLYASQTGNAESLAQTLHQRLSNEGYPCTLSSTLDFNIKNLTSYSVIIIIASTHGEGEPPDDAIEFYEAIGGKKAPRLENIQHAVLSLGDSSYEFFCQTGKDFDQALLGLGSSNLVERLDCDVDYQADAERWIDNVVNKVIHLHQATEATSTSATNVEKFPAIEYSKTNPYLANITTIQKITGQGSSKRTYHLEIDLQNSGLTYQPGDSLAVISKNHHSLVQAILLATGLNKHDTANFQQESHTLEYLLTEKLEVTLLNKNFIQQIADLADSSTLQAIVRSEFSEYIKNHQVIDVLLCANIPLQAQQLVDLLKPLKPRLYSISSSADAVGEEVHITLNQVREQNETATRYGLASNYLTETLDENSQIEIFVEPNKHFKLPAAERDIIMIGSGTGIAPFRAFLQQRETDRAAGKNWLFFGNPNFNTDFLYQLELQKHLKSNLLTRLDVAFSRDQAQKIYVQHKLQEQAEKIWQWLQNDAVIYVCGDMQKMAKDVQAALLEIIQQQGALEPDEAKKYLTNLKKENRYQRDVY